MSVQVMPKPTWSQLAKAVSDLVTHRDGEWCGFPMPLPGKGLMLESRHPFADKITEIQKAVDGDLCEAAASRTSAEDDADGWSVVNSWRSLEKGGEVLVLHHKDGRKTWALDPYAPRRNRFWLGPLETIDAWNLDTECTAIDRLATLLSERMFAAYVLTGTFLETSRRSGLTYIFRRCRPTLVFTPNSPRRSGEMSILSALCLHPIGYYAQSFSGALTPTDDVIAHLLLMRGDEHMYWRRANQHNASAPEAGL